MDFSTEVDFVELTEDELAFSFWTAVPSYITLHIVI
jgi:hypothetical protein